MRFEMLVDVDPGRARAGAALRDWLSIGLGPLGGPYAEAAWRRAPLPEEALRGQGPFGRPGELWADMSVRQGADLQRSATRPLTAGIWQDFLDVAGSLPHDAVLRLCPLDADGKPRGQPQVHVEGTLRYGSEMPDRVADDWLQLIAYIPDHWLAAEDYVEPMMAAWLDVAHRCNPVYGEVGAGDGLMTELESHLRGADGNSLRNVPRARHRLRGYGWLTICPQELGNQLGGASYFSDSKAFVQVVPLDAGGYWLRATPTYAGYDMAAAERVFRALAPVLIPGQPSIRADRPHMLVPEHPRPAEAARPERDRGYTRPGPTRAVETLPIYTLVATGERVTILGSVEWGWELLRNGIAYHGWGHNKPDGDRYIKILAELRISMDVGHTVVQWEPQPPDDEGNPRYRAVLGDPAIAGP